MVHVHVSTLYMQYMYRIVIRFIHPLLTLTVEQNVPVRTITFYVIFLYLILLGYPCFYPMLFQL